MCFTHTHHYLHSTPLSSHTHTHTHTHTHKPDCALFRQDLFFAISSFLPGLTCSTLLLICSIFTVLFTIAAPWQWHAFARWTATVKLLWWTRLSTYEWKQQRDVWEIKYQLMLRGVFRDADWSIVFQPLKNTTQWHIFIQNEMSKIMAISYVHIILLKGLECVYFFMFL